MVRAMGGWVMWFEVFEAGRERGVIGSARSDDGAAWRYDGIVLREPFHLSYPCVVPWAGEHYMVPETLALGGIHLYRAHRFPDVWRRECCLVEGTFADPTVMRVGNGWAMYACGRPRTHDVLHLFVADALTGPWREHPASPVVRDDPRRGRPGGRPIVDEGRRIRFSQDCAAGYGRGLRALHVETLDATRYAEHDLDAAPVLHGTEPAWCAGGVHHLDAHALPDGTWIACHDGRP